MTHRYGDTIDVATMVYPEAFTWRGRSYEVIRVLRRWRERGPWWSGDSVRSGRRIECWRVEARDDAARAGIFDLARDLESQAWHLERIWD